MLSLVPLHYFSTLTLPTIPLPTLSIYTAFLNAASFSGLFSFGCLWWAWPGSLDCLLWTRTLQSLPGCSSCSTLFRFYYIPVLACRAMSYDTVYGVLHGSLSETSMTGTFHELMLYVATKQWMYKYIKCGYAHVHLAWYAHICTVHCAYMKELTTLFCWCRVCSSSSFMLYAMTEWNPNWVRPSPPSGSGAGRNALFAIER